MKWVEKFFVLPVVAMPGKTKVTCSRIKYAIYHSVAFVHSLFSIVTVVWFLPCVLTRICNCYIRMLRCHPSNATEFIS